MRSVLLAVLAAALLTPAAAAAQSAPFAPLPEAPQEQQAPVAVDSGTDDGGISALAQGLLILAGVALVLGIGFAIARDARRNAPAEARPGREAGTPTAEGMGERKKPDPRAAQKQKAAAKRARQARKKNRPVR